MVLVRQVWQVLVVQGLLCDLAGACGPLRDMPAGKQRVCDRCQNANGCGTTMQRCLVAVHTRRMLEAPVAASAAEASALLHDGGSQWAAST